MDGNGRWAAQRKRPRLEGHRRGAKAVRKTVEFARKNGIRYLTLYAFSTENWQRPKFEVSGLMQLLSQYLDSEMDELHEKGVRFTTIGDISRLPRRLRDKIDKSKERTADNRDLTLVLALSYGGRADIVRAARTMAKAVRNGKTAPEDIDEELLSEHLYTSDLPNPDLLIRTGGEVRISNFLLWQCAYSELYFTPVLWPDFDEQTFMAALEDYAARQRRFGMTSDQIEKETVAT